MVAVVETRKETLNVWLVVVLVLWAVELVRLVDEGGGGCGGEVAAVAVVSLGPWGGWAASELRHKSGVIRRQQGVAGPSQGRPEALPRRAPTPFVPRPLH